MNNKIKVFTSFTGIGSQEMALRNIGLDFEVVGISEVDRYAILAYDAIHNEQIEVENVSKEEMLEEIKSKNIAYNFSTEKSEIPRGLKDIKKLYDAHIRCKNYGDIRVIDENNLPDFDLFTYSYPCKSISVAGKQEGLVEGSNTQSSLLWECKRIISTKKPKYLLMENVKNLVGKNHIEEFEKLCDYLKDLGYNNYWAVLNGKDFGTPQNRERVIMISILKEFDNGYSLPIGYPLTKTLTDILDINVDKKEFFEPNLYNHINFNSTEKFNKLVMVGLLGIKGKDAIRRIYSENGLCPTLDAMQGGNRMPKVYLNDNTARRITPLECWRLQGFLDEDFYKAKNIGGLSNSKLYERAGRGIVVPMLEDVFNKLFIGKE